MITHNGKQVTLAMRNRKAINLIARNGKAMFGELEDLRMYGITYAAKAVILAEYGSVVWSDVKQYAKAHPQIVEFINQDPHLACSISPNSNKERWLVGDGKAWIQVPVSISTSDTITTIVKSMESATTFQCLFSTSQSRVFRLWVSNSKCICTINGTESLPIHFSGIGKFEYNGESWSVNGLIVNTYKGTPVIADSFCLYNLSSSGSRQPISAMSEFNVKDKLHFLPCLYNGIAGMVDAISGTFHPNANTEGTFTIAITDKE